MRLFTYVAWALAIALVACSLGRAHAQSPPAAGTKLACDDPSDDEAEALRSQSAVHRRSAHVLTVTARSRTFWFKDVPPYNETFSGKAYYFCDHQNGLILIAAWYEEFFTGKLLDERTGRLLPGGQTVIVSPDRKSYLAAEQEDGEDGERWTLRRTGDGSSMWKGFSGEIDPPVKGSDFEYLEDPAWTAKGDLVANASCAHGSPDSKSQVKLTWVGKSLVWLPWLKCPPVTADVVVMRPPA